MLISEAARTSLRRPGVDSTMMWCVDTGQIMATLYPQKRSKDPSPGQGCPPKPKVPFKYPN